MATSPKIIKLDEVVVNRIAAGEVIQRPANAIKEMIENSIDANARNIQVTVKNGGLKLIQIQDDGCGIRKSDMSIVCERFTTSKLQCFDDLRSIATFGFRGEALASISHVAHLMITTKTADSPCAFKAKYEDGKILPWQPGGRPEPKPCAGNKGTQISVEDLFYNVAVRQKAFKSGNEEYQKIADVISKYAIHNAKIGFTLKKFGENIANVRTQPNSTVLNNIKTIYGPTVSRELIELEHTDEKYQFKINGYISNANYSVKKFTMLLFINHRLVESNALKKSIDMVYSNYLPKEKHPFVYLSLEIHPGNVDVNVHPTKHEVRFLHEDVIIEQIQKVIETKLLGSNESRHYYTQMLLPKLAASTVECPISDVLSNDEKENREKTMYPQHVVRTDPRERKLQAFYSPLSKNKDNNVTDSICSNESEMEIQSSDAVDISKENPIDISGSEKIETKKQKEIRNINDNDTSPALCAKENAMEINSNDKSSIRETSSKSVSNDTIEDETPKVAFPDINTPEIEKAVTAKRRRVDLTSSTKRLIKLTSVKTLRERIDKTEHLGLKNLLEDHKFVGCVDESLSLVQHLTRLYLVNTKKLMQELFYQILIFQFGNFGYLELSTPGPIYELVMLALNSPESGWSPEDGTKENLAKYVVDLLQSKAEMLMDYFSMEISDKGELVCLPLLLEKYTKPNWHKLPMFLLRLATEVDWESEVGCFDSFCRECSTFFASPPEFFDDSNEENDVTKYWKHLIEHVIFPALRNSIIPPKTFSEDGTFLEVANLPDLYKVFERC